MFNTDPDKSPSSIIYKSIINGVLVLKNEKQYNNAVDALLDNINTKDEGYKGTIVEAELNRVITGLTILIENYNKEQAKQEAIRVALDLKYNTEKLSE